MLEEQALTLFESIRLWSGAYSRSALYALSPRAGHAISARARRRLSALGVQYDATVLNTDCAEYGSANRVAAAAHVEARTAHDVLVVLDSDTLFLAEPAAFALGDGVEVAVRPVDVKGQSTAGPQDASDGYWRALCEIGGVAYDELPWSQASVDGARIRANYNGGLVVVRGGRGILQEWARVFFESARRGLRPREQADRFRSGVRWIEPEVGRWWGSNQAALAVAVARRAVVELPATYNFPLHLWRELGEARLEPLSRAVHVHYHWMFDADAIGENPLLRMPGALTGEQRLWLGRKTPWGAG